MSKSFEFLNLKKIKNLPLFIQEGDFLFFIYGAVAAESSKVPTAKVEATTGAVVSL